MLNLTEATLSLQAVLTTEQLSVRPIRPPDFQAVNKAFATLQSECVKQPGIVLQRFTELLLDLCAAHSAGISVLEKNEDRLVFRWHAIAGVYAPYRWGSMPRSASPCGVVLNTEAVQLFKYPERHFPYSIPLNPPICEALLTPFRLCEQVIGTVWLIAHDEIRKFDQEDLRRMEAFLHLMTVAYENSCKMLQS
jgi:hypothetical protein